MELSKSDYRFITTWAKKIKAINFLGNKCNCCGNEDFRVLEFHHQDGIKEANIGKIKEYRWVSVEIELEKCILLCRNCHAELHCNINGRTQKEKNKFLNIIGKFNCSLCGYRGKNYASLDFHHLREKDFIISDAMGRHVKKSLQEILDEIDKCNLICRNCHILKHTDTERIEKFKEKIYLKTKYHRNNLEPLDPDVVYKMFSDGMKQCDIAKQTGRGKSTISTIIKRFENKR